MPNFRKHWVINLSIIIITMVYALYAGIELNPLYYIFIMGYMIGTLYITPDLDISSTASKKGYGIWKPYSWIFKHRGLTHNILIGFMLPILYLTIILVIIISLFILSGHQEFVFETYRFVIPFLKIYSLEIIIAFAGLVTAYTIHIIADRLL